MCYSKRWFLCLPACAVSVVVSLVVGWCGISKKVVAIQPFAVDFRFGWWGAGRRLNKTGEKKNANKLVISVSASGATRK